MKCPEDADSWRRPRKKSWNEYFESCDSTMVCYCTRDAKHTGPHHFHDENGKCILVWGKSKPGPDNNCKHEMFRCKCLNEDHKNDFGDK